MASGLELAANHFPLWSPTGDRIAFSWSDDPHHRFIGTRARAPRAGRRERNSHLAGECSRERRLPAIAFSPDGDRILFATTDTDVLWSVRADGSDAQHLVTGTSWGDWQ